LRKALLQASLFEEETILYAIEGIVLLLLSFDGQERGKEAPETARQMAVGWNPAIN